MSADDHPDDGLDGFDDDDLLDVRWDDLQLDDGFVASASIKEAAATERVRRPEPRPVPTGTRTAARRRARRARRAARSFEYRVVRAGAAVLLVILVVVIVIEQRPEPAPNLDLIPSGLGLDLIADGVDPDDPHPTPGGAVERLRPEVEDPGGDGAHEFIQRQAITDEPLAWDPCRPVPFVVAPDMPGEVVEMVRSVLDEVGELTGLEVVFEGETDEEPSEDRAAYQPTRYGDRWAPVLVAWTSPSEIPGLEGDVVGLGGGAAYTPAGEETAVYVTGLVWLDGPDVEQGLAASWGRDMIEGLIRHEIGHAIGLAHVQSLGEVMDEWGSELGDFGPGDREGLAALGRGPCQPAA